MRVMGEWPCAGCKLFDIVQLPRNGVTVPAVHWELKRGEMIQFGPL